MKFKGYTIPGYFENCIIKGNEIKEDKFIGKTIYKYSNNELKEPKMFGATVLVFKQGGIYKPGFAGKKLFSVSPNGDVREIGLLGKIVGKIPIEWTQKSVYKSELSNDDKLENSGVSISVELDYIDNKREQTVANVKNECDINTGWVADFSNVKVGSSTITCPKKYSCITAIALALAKEGLKNVKVHAGVFSINMRNVHGYNFIVDLDNPYFYSDDGILYNKNKTEILSFPHDKIVSDFKMPSTIKIIGDYAFSFSMAECFIVPDSIVKIGEGAFSYNKKLKSIYIPKTVSTIAKDAFLESKKVVLNTAFCEKPSGWEIDLSTLKNVNWNVTETK